MLPSKAKWNFINMNDNSFLIDDTLSSLTNQLLYQRKIETKEEAKHFLHPQLEQLHDPLSMHDMKKAVERVRDAVAKQQRILVFGDYDADGVSSTAVLVETLREMGAIVDYYIPNRFTEGYGPNEAAFRQAKEHGVQLIITVDTGIAAHHEANVAEQLGMDLIITDHHEVQETLPNAYAVVHPKCSSDYPFQELAGVGVAFKLAHALLEQFPKHLLDLVAIGTIADLVPLIGENRVLAYYGLQALTRSIRPGVQQLKEVCGIEGHMTEDDVGFSIGPRLNAVGRLQDAAPAVELLLTEENEEAAYLANQINALNEERKQIVADIAEEAEAMLQVAGTELPPVIVVAKEGWNQGVLGIVASRLVNRYDRPVIALTVDQEANIAKGSARSIEAFDLFTNCMEVRDLFTHFGGHAQAAGMTLPIENVDLLRDKLCEQADLQLTAEDFRQTLRIDSSLLLKDVCLQTIEEINALAPFGMGNPKPLFCLESYAPVEMRQLGSKLNHLKLKLREEDHELDAIGFGLGDLYPRISPHSPISIVGELSINEWNGRKKPQIMMRDVKVANRQLFDYRGNRHLQKVMKDVPTHNGIAIFFQPMTEKDDWVFEHVDAWEILDDDMVEEIPLEQVDHLILMDLPPSLHRLSIVLQKMTPHNIYACYYTEEAAFLNTVPTREHFKWFYGMLMKRKQFHLDREGPKLAQYKGWTYDTVKFIANVFSELEFVKIENGLITLHANPTKKDLTASTLYQSKQQHLHVEQTLYFSTYKQLKQWFDEQINGVFPLKEEVINES
ncbi:single-stranded-DNA-specific exonuclease RecJ [Pontibacillus litoralis]|uniref:Single-stranded-DNA-specific exonuclease RecJ n=1 Tax=Pontibacillus litoralis JSM 072002 TaxID=1385512 RepID=A0A0A5G792_9BACI|nr:single-stranded-DNA-specific exonuclease RecJ [Pontibacillus litoralis]KGX88986.1 recombination protein RecJ [Pontibacillus litoralis JSM 072002]